MRTSVAACTRISASRCGTRPRSPRNLSGLKCSASMVTVTHCIFDMDGLLLDTESFYTIVQQKILQRFGKEFTWELKAKMMGQKALPAAQTMVSELGLEGQLQAEDFVKEREEMLHTMFPEAKLLPGVAKLINHLQDSNVPVCVATSSHKRHFDLKTQKHGPFFQQFDHIITGDNVTNGKPAPDIFLKACETWETPPSPSNCLVFEDAPTGVTAAKAAGMHCVMVPDANLDRASTKEADAVINSLLEVPLEQFGLPALPAE